MLIRSLLSWKSRNRIAVPEDEPVAILTACEQIFTCPAVQRVATRTALQRVVASEASNLHYS